jgi:hypothetical protein
MSNYELNDNGLVETQFDLNKTKLYFDEFNDTLNDTLRDVDKTRELMLANIYSYKKTKAQNKLLFIIIIICVIIILIATLNKTFNLLNDDAYVGLIGIILGFTFIYVGYSLWVFSYKDTLNYDEFNYGAFGTMNPGTDSSKTKKTDYTTPDISNCDVSELKESDKTIKTFFKNL